MPAKIISANNAEHYTWGRSIGGRNAGETNPAENSDSAPPETLCDGWHLVKTPDLSIIEELMPPGTSETRHSHVHARQFFFVLEGELTLEIEHDDFLLHPGEGIEIAPGQPHQAFNRGSGPVRILVTSHPHSHGDRVPE